MSSSVKYFDRQNRAACAMIAINQKGVLCYTCLECDAELGSAESYEAHKFKEHKVVVQKAGSSAPKKRAVKNDVKCKNVKNDVKCRKGIKKKDSGTDSVTKTIFTCFVCSKDFTTKESIRRHIDTIHKNYAYKCSACIKSFETKEQLEKHKSIHGTEFKYECPVCRKGLLTVYEAKKHIRLCDQ